MKASRDALEQKVISLGTEIFEEVQDSSLSVFDPEFYTGKLINWAMQDAEFKLALFRFVDVLPSLTRSSDIITHVQEYFNPVAHRIPGLLKWGLNLNPNSLPAKIAAQLVRKQIRSMAERFILGENCAQALKPLRGIRKNGLAFTVDLLGEKCVSEKEARTYLERYLELLVDLNEAAAKWPESKPLLEGHCLEHSPVNVSVKLSALYSQISPVNTARSVSILSERLGEIIRKAKEFGAYVYVDMEDTSSRAIVLETFKNTLSLPEFKDYDRCGIVLQTYLRQTKADLDELIAWTKNRGVPIGVRLVKGAYWDTETILAVQKDRPIPVWQEKSISDKVYEELSITLLENSKLMVPSFASHNIRSLCFAVKTAEALEVPRTQFSLQTLYGMAEPIKNAFAQRGFLVREYAPIGELIPGMGYLVRRLLENTSNEGFLRQSFHENESPETLLAKPDPKLKDSADAHLNLNLREEFSNSPLMSFTKADVRQKVSEQLALTREQLSEEAETVYPVIDGELHGANHEVDSISPENTKLTLAKIQLSNTTLAEKSLLSLKKYFPTWRDTPTEARAEVLFQAAELMDERRHELMALIVLEAGKPWIEADADVAEAIDFCNYYAHQALEMSTPLRLGNLPGEENSYFYEPRGIAAVIAPWNFPLAITCGMFSAALVTGNCAVLKPSVQTSLVASKCFQIFLDAGLPPQAASFLPGRGREIGSYLVEHPLVSTIAFTGSNQVGLGMITAASIVHDGQEHIKRVVAELGGKNAIIVDTGAHLDAAVDGVVSSAFGYQGQKCSACSRAIVVEGVYDKFVERLAEATKSIIVGPPSNPATFVGPVINGPSHTRLLQVIEEAKRDCTLLAEGMEPQQSSGPGYYVRPTVFTDIPSEHALLSSELFGPILAVIKAPSFETALEMALDSQYGLTGAVYSRNPKHLALAAKDFRVGNLYLNRGSTGALVCRQPFGGVKMSGVGSKAGGPDYLLQFVYPRTVTENTMRRGFIPT